MICTICSTQFACSFHNRAEGVIGVQFVVGSISHAGVFQDEVADTCRLDSPHVVGFHPVAVSVEETNSLGCILADRVPAVPRGIARKAISYQSSSSVQPSRAGKYVRSAP